MNNPKLLLVTLSIAATASVDAQQLYKSVGPDGKVTFSDRAPAGQGKVSVMRSNILRPLEDTTPTGGTTLPPVPKMPKSTLPDRPATAYARAPSTPELEEAVTAVMLLQEVAKKFEPVCSPTSQAGNAVGSPGTELEFAL